MLTEKEFINLVFYFEVRGFIWTPWICFSAASPLEDDSQNPRMGSTSCMMKQLVEKDHQPIAKGIKWSHLEEKKRTSRCDKMPNNFDELFTQRGIFSICM